MARQLKGKLMPITKEDKPLEMVAVTEEMKGFQRVPEAPRGAHERLAGRPPPQEGGGGCQEGGGGREGGQDEVILFDGISRGFFRLAVPRSRIGVVFMTETTNYRRETDFSRRLPPYAPSPDARVPPTPPNRSPTPPVAFRRRVERVLRRRMEPVVERGVCPARGGPRHPAGRYSASPALNSASARFVSLARSNSGNALRSPRSTRLNSADRRRPRVHPRARRRPRPRRRRRDRRNRPLASKSFDALPFPVPFPLPSNAASMMMSSASSARSTRSVAPGSPYRAPPPLRRVLPRRRRRRRRTVSTRASRRRRPRRWGRSPRS